MIMSSCVYYKFKSKKESSKIFFDGSSISIKDLREKIILHSGLKANDMVLKIERPKDSSNSSKEEYKDDDIVKKFTTVIVSRMPCTKRDQTRSKIANPEIMSKKDPYKSMSKESGDLKFHEMSKATKLYDLDVSEDDKITLMMKQSTDNFFIDRNHRNRGQPPGPPPATYVCHKCNMGGHYVHQCPGIKDKDGNPVDLKNLKRPTGIPQDFLVEVSKDTPGAYLTKDGRYALTIKDRDAYAQGKKEKRPFSEEENPVYVPTERKPVDMIVCQLCQKVMRDAVFISCCGYSYCQECLTDYVFNTDVNGCGRCPNCNAVVESAESFVPNPAIREMVHKYNSGATNLFTQSVSSSYQFKSDSGTGSSSAISPALTATKSAIVGKSYDKQSTVNAPLPQTSDPLQQAASSVKGSEDEVKGKSKEKDSSAIRGPFVDGRRVLKPKPPPDVVLSRRSDTLKTEVNPASKAADVGSKPTKEEVTAGQPEVEIDLGLDEMLDNFDKSNEKNETPTPAKEESSVDSKLVKEKSPSSSPKSKEVPSKTDNTETRASPEPSSGETIPVHSFERNYGSYHERNWSGIGRNANNGNQGPTGPLGAAVLAQHPSHGHSGSVPPLIPAVTAAAPSAVSNVAAVGAPSVPAAVSVVAAPSAVSNVPAIGAQSAIGGSHGFTAAFPPSVYTGVNVLPCFMPHQTVAGSTVSPSSLYGYNGVSGRHTITPVVIPEPPILSEEQFNKLKRDLIAEESKHGRRPRRFRSRSHSFSRSRSRSRNRRRSKSPPRRHRSSRDRKTRDARKHASSPHDSRYGRNRNRGSSPHQSSRVGSRSNRESSSPVRYADSVSSGHHLSSPTHVAEPRISSHNAKHAAKRRRHSQECSPDRERQPHQKRGENADAKWKSTHKKMGRTSPEEPVSMKAKKAAPWSPHASEDRSSSEWKQHPHAGGDTEKFISKDHQRSKTDSTESTPNSYSSLPFDLLPSRKRRKMEESETKPHPMKHSHSQSSLPSYYDRRAQSHTSEKKVADKHEIRKHSKKSVLKNLKPTNESEIEKHDNPAHSKPDKSNESWYSETNAFLKNLRDRERHDTHSTSPVISGEPCQNTSPKSPDILGKKVLPNPKKVYHQKPVKDKRDHSETDKKQLPKAIIPVKEDKKREKDGVSKRKVEGKCIPEEKQEVRAKCAQPVDSSSDFKKKKKDKKEKKEKKKDKKKKKKKKNRKDDKEKVESVSTIDKRPCTLEKDGSKATNYTSSDHDSPSPLIPPPSKWELELDEHTNEFEEELRQAEKLRNSRIQSLVSSVNYRRVEDDGLKRGSYERMK